MVIHYPKTVDSRTPGKDEKAAESQAGADNDDACRCKEASEDVAWPAFQAHGERPGVLEKGEKRLILDRVKVIGNIYWKALGSGHQLHHY